jgi:DUF4097 and DUF4098 domain-containing protein YvlB
MEERVEKTFSTPDGCDLIVENVRGEIAVEGWDRPETEVVAIQRHGKVEIEITQQGRQVIARTKHEHDGFAWLKWLTKGSAPTVDYQVYAPIASNLRLKNVSGPIHATHITGTVTINNVDGTAVLRQISGQTSAETVNGTLMASDLNGTAKLNTVNGKMKVLSGALQELQADTVNGGIEIVSDLSSAGTYVFHTVNGGCRLGVSPDFRAHVSAHGVNVSVDCQLPSQSVERSFGKWQGTIGTGEGPYAEIHFETVNGKLQIENGQLQKEPSSTSQQDQFVAKVETTPPPPASPVTPAPPPPTEPVEVKVAPSPSTETSLSQTEILKRVEKGEISVDEAIKLLQGES